MILYNISSFPFQILKEKHVTVYSASKLYEHAFKMMWDWKKLLPSDVYDYHSLVYKEVNAPVELQMGVLLPFISTICGPLVRGSLLTRPCIINLFWINVAASGVGKTQSRKKMVSEPLKFILSNTDHAVEDFKVSKYTKTGNYILI